MEKFEIGDIVLCKVDKIVGTAVFVKIGEKGEFGEGTIITSEIAPGRIRNLRDYVVPNKIIVCKVLRAEKGYVDLSLRRVSAKEKKHVMDIYGKEKNIIATLKTVLKDKADNIIDKIKKQNSVYEFLQEAKENPSILEKLAGKTDAEKIIKILKEKKEKQVEVKKHLILKCAKSNGIDVIKNVLDIGKDADTNISYISASKFLINIRAKDYKEANSKALTIINNITEKAKKNHCEFSLEK